MSPMVADAVSAWGRAPVHIRAMAGAYVGPLLAAIVEQEGVVMALADCVEGVLERLEALEGRAHG